MGSAIMCSTATKNTKASAQVVMSTIPTTFDQGLPSYTAVGGTERQADTGLSAVLLNRPGPCSRYSYFQEMERTGFDYVVSIEASSEPYDLEDLSRRFPFVRFILPGAALSPGEQINLAASDLDSPLFFVLWNDVKIIEGGSAKQMVELVKKEQGESKTSGGTNLYQRLCTVPVFWNSHSGNLPTLAAPVVYKKKIETMLFSPHSEGLPSLYPYGGMGIYDRDRFRRTGGFDGTLKSAYWQSMDFGFRSHLWGEEICVSQQLKLSYNGPSPSEDHTAEESYRRFYFKNLAPVFRRDHAYMPLRIFPRLLFSFQAGLLRSWEDFTDTRLWVRANSFRWRGDVQSIIGRWDGVLGNGES
jgi:hypothetical protein